MVVVNCRGVRVAMLARAIWHPAMELRIFGGDRSEMSRILVLFNGAQHSKPGQRVG